MIRPYDRAAQEFAEHPLRTTEIPVEDYVSELLPTLRWSRPAYTGFAAPAAGSPGQPLTVGTPGPWWAFDADNGRLLAYALASEIPFPDPFLEGPVTVQPPNRSFSAVKEDRKLLGELMTAAVPAFFGGETGDGNLRGDLAGVIGQVVPQELMPWHKALARDFFDWLERR
jgi:hypothetical protein